MALANALLRHFRFPGTLLTSLLLAHISMLSIRKMRRAIVCAISGIMHAGGFIHGHQFVANEKRFSQAFELGYIAPLLPNFFR